MEFEATIESLPQMLLFIKEAAFSFDLDQETIRKLELAAEEAIVNIISYAYPHPEKKKEKIGIFFEKHGRTRFEITLRDQGAPFNPLDLEIDIDINKPLHERKIGGLGIYLIEQLMDEVSYKREGEENVLQMVINLT